MGAWIETKHSLFFGFRSMVAPYVGAWIETTSCDIDFTARESHPTWVRGLKPLLRGLCVLARSRTLRGCVD